MLYALLTIVVTTDLKNGACHLAKGTNLNPQPAIRAFWRSEKP